jgi:tetratricopeptide (TPR) repeat protein
MKKKYLVFCCVIFTSLLFCQINTDSTIESNKKNKIFLLQLNKDYENLSTNEKVKRDFYLSLIYFKEAAADSALLYIDKAEKIALINQTNIGLDQIYYRKGKVLNAIGFYDSALKYFLKAYELSFKKKDIKRINEINLFLGICYSNLGRITKAKEILNQYLSINEIVDKSEGYNNLAICYAKEEKYDEARKYFIEGFHEAEKKKNEIAQIEILTNISCMYVEEQNFLKSLEYSLLAKDKIVDYKHNSNAFESLLNLNIGVSYSGLGNYSKAENYLKGALLNLSNKDAEIIIFQNLISIYDKTKNEKQKIIFLEKLNNSYDTLLKSKNKNFTKLIDKHIELVKNEFKNEELVKQNRIIKERSSYQSILILLLIFLLLISLLLFYKNYRYIKNKKALDALNEKQTKILEEQVKLKENEVGTIAVAMSEKIDILNQLKKELENNQGNVEVIKNKINNLVDSSSNVDFIKNKLEYRFPEFFTKLLIKHPELSITEVRYCVLTKLNMSIKETANILNVSPDTVKVTRSKLKKKINVPVDVTFKEYLDDISKN